MTMGLFFYIFEYFNYILLLWINNIKEVFKNDQRS